MGHPIRVSFGVTQQKVRLLLEELRSWALGEVRLTLHELGEKFGLEEFVIEQVARSEGLDLILSHPEPGADPAASTIDLDPVAVQEAVANPEVDPAYADHDTGVWRKKPTGEWELVDGKERKDD
jgi:hypothetical protein